MNFVIQACVLSALAITITACGGGEGAGGVDSSSTGGSGSSGTSNGTGTGTPTGNSQEIIKAYADVKPSMAACLSCHASGGIAGNTNLILDSNDDTATIAALKTYASTFGQSLLLSKSIGQPSHQGGNVFGSTTSAAYIKLEQLLTLFTTTQSTSSTDLSFKKEAPSQTYRRASLYLTGTIPSTSKTQSLENASDETLRTEIIALMQGDGFKNFLKNGANERLNSRHLRTSSAGVNFYNKYYLPNASNQERRNIVRRDLAEEPLEIIANVVMKDRPYSEILTANYTMVSQFTDESYNTGLTLAAGEWREAQNKGQDAKMPSTFFADATGASRIASFPHAGVLSTWSYLSKYGTTATNRNRARSRWTMQHFLGFDIEQSASRPLNFDDISDEDNPTMDNPACSTCHQTLDPIAGAFKYFHERVGYKASGTDSLDRNYRNRNPGVDWYKNMRPAGFGSQDASGGDPLQWLAQRLVEDERFAVGAVKFWWHAVFGENVLNSSAPTVQFETQTAYINNLANEFRKDLNLKKLLANMMLTDYFRASQKVDAAAADDQLSIHMGGRRLLSGYELMKKTESLTGIVWGNTNPRLTGEYKMLYGGTDDITVEKRATEMASIMFRVAVRHANEISCAAVVNDFSFDQSARRLFTQVERTTLDEAAIRNQIVVLYERLLNRVVSSSSNEVNQAYQLFLDLRAARISQGGTNVNSNTRCDNRIGGSTNDASFVLVPWRGVMIALMSDPDYLFE